MPDHSQSPYDRYSGKASDVTRHLAYAGFGIIWLLRRDDMPSPCFPPQLMLPALLLGSALALDALHYLLASLLLDLGKPHDSRLVAFVTRATFYLKMVLVLVAYGKIVAYVSGWMAWK